MNSAAGLRVRLFEEFVKERTLLEHALADLLGRPAEDLFCILTARFAAVVMELVADRAQNLSDDPTTAEQQILQVAQHDMDQLQQERRSCHASTHSRSEPRGSSWQG